MINVEGILGKQRIPVSHTTSSHLDLRKDVVCDHLDRIILVAARNQVHLLRASSLNTQLLRTPQPS